MYIFGFLMTSWSYFVVMLCINIFSYLFFIIFLYFWGRLLTKIKNNDAKRKKYYR
jgi:uncharacterized membrane protein